MLGTYASGVWYNVGIDGLDVADPGDPPLGVSYNFFNDDFERSSTTGTWLIEIRRAGTSAVVTSATLTFDIDCEFCTG